jgi:hypothetical protein
LTQSEYNNGGSSNPTVNASTGTLDYGVQLLPDFSTNLAIIQITNGVNGGTYKLDLTGAGNLSALLGFAPAIYNTTVESSVLPQFNAGIDQFQVRSDLIRNSYNNGVQAPILFNFAPNGVPPSAAYTIEPLHISYLQVKKSLIDNAIFALTDQNGNIIDLQGMDQVFVVNFRRILA